MKRIVPIVIFCLTILILGSMTAYAIYQNTAFDFTINGITSKCNDAYCEVIPDTLFSAEISVTNKGAANKIMVLLAAYSENGQMLGVQYQTKSFGTSETATCSFEVDNSSGSISLLKAFLLNSDKKLIPVARAFSISNLDLVASAYINDYDELVVRTTSGEELIVSNTVSSGSSFSDYEIGTKFHLEYPKGEFDIPVTVAGNSYIFHMNEVYYELTGINDISDASAWSENDYTSWGCNYFARYDLVMHIRATTTADLAGAFVSFYLSDNMLRHKFDGTVAEDGTITINQEINQDGGQYWFSPRELYFWLINLTPAK